MVVYTGVYENTEQKNCIDMDSPQSSLATEVYPVDQSISELFRVDVILTGTDLAR